MRIFQSLLSIAINRQQFFFSNTFDQYIDSFPHGQQQFSVKEQGLKFYVIYTGIIVENGSVFTKKIKDRGSMRASSSSKKDLNELTKPLDQNVTYQQTKNDYDLVMITIKEKSANATTDYIRRCNMIQRYVKTV